MCKVFSLKSMLQFFSWKISKQQCICRCYRPFQCLKLFENVTYEKKLTYVSIILGMYAWFYLTCKHIDTSRLYDCFVYLVCWQHLRGIKILWKTCYSSEDSYGILSRPGWQGPSLCSLMSWTTLTVKKIVIATIICMAEQFITNDAFVFSRASFPMFFYY
jgi:hypothetical protein